MRRTQVIYNGFDLTSLYHVSKLETPLLPREIKSTDVPGRDGSIYLGVKIESRTITLQLTAKGRSLEERQEAARHLASLLATDEPAPLSISTDGGLYYMAIPSSPNNAAIYANHTTFPVEFYCPDPVAFGDRKSITVPSGGSVTFRVYGTYPTLPIVIAASAANGSDGYWRLGMEDGSYLVATIPDGVETAPLVADCTTRVLTVNDEVTLLAPEADWITFEPGTHTLTMVGTGAATVQYDERWL